MDERAGPACAAKAEHRNRTECRMLLNSKDALDSTSELSCDENALDPRGGRG